MLIPLLEKLDDLPYLDYPELQIDEHEFTEMPFRYIKNEDGSPFMPPVSSSMNDLMVQCWRMPA